MTIARLVICEWKGDSRSDETVDDPAWPKVEAAIRALNACNLNDLYLTPDEAEPESFLAVGGGCGRYLVSGSIRNERFPTLVDPGIAGGETARLIVGGQEGEYPENCIVDLNLALRAAKSYWELAQFDPDLDWVDA